MSTATPAVKPQNSTTKIKGLLEKSHFHLAAVLPKHMTPERVIQVVSTMVYRTPKLQDCVPETILTAVVRAASLGLDLEPSMNECFLIPRWNNQAKASECQFQIGYQGLRKLAMNSGQIAYIKANVVREGDLFVYQFTPDLEFRHAPAPGSNRPIILVYCVAKLANGEHLIETMSAEELEGIHRRSEGYKNAVKYGKEETGPWVTDRTEMEKKTVLKRLTKSLPRSLQLAEAVYADDAEYRDAQVSAMAPRPLSGSAALKNRLMPPVATEPEFTTTEGVQSPIRSEDDDPEPYGPETTIDDDLEGREAGVRG